MRLSVILPVYKVEKYLSSCLESLYFQGLDESEFEIIAVDDGSPDRCKDILETYGKTHTNLRTIRQYNRGVSAARNEGLVRAKGEYILFADPDDVLVSGSLSILLQEASSRNLDVLRGQFIKTEDPEPPSLTASIPKEGYSVSSTLNGKLYFLKHFDPFSGYIFINLFRKEFLVSNGLSFREGISLSEDTLFSVRFLLANGKVADITLPFYLYRQHENSAVASCNLHKLYSICAVHDEYLQMEKQAQEMEIRKKLRACAHASFSLFIWYLIRQPLLYDRRKDILAHTGSSLRKTPLYGTFPQKLSLLLFRVSPYVYLFLRNRFHK